MEDDSGYTMEQLREGAATGPVEIDPNTGLAQSVVTVTAPPTTQPNPWPWVGLILGAFVVLKYLKRG